MMLILVLVFVGVFLVVALVVSASMGGDRQAKQVIATLDSALATESVEARNEILNLRKSDKLSTIPWLNHRLLKSRSDRCCAACSHRPISSGQWAACSRCASSVLLFRPTCSIGARAPCRWPFWSERSWASCDRHCDVQRSKRFGKFEKGLPEALDMMVSALRAGHSLIAAMGLVARESPDPIGTEFRICFEEQNYGLEMKTAIDNLLNRIPMQDLRIVATAIMIQKETGGNLAEVLDKTSWVIRERFRLKRQVATHTAQGRMTGIVLTLLPIILGIALYFVNPTLMSILWTRPIGIKLLWVASIMIVIAA